MKTEVIPIEHHSDSAQLYASILTDFDVDVSDTDALRRARHGLGVHKYALPDFSGKMSIYSASFWLNSPSMSLYTDNDGMRVSVRDISTFCATYAYRADLYLKREFQGQGLGFSLFNSTIRTYLDHTRDFHAGHSMFIGLTDNPAVLAMASRLGGYEIDPADYNVWSPVELKAINASRSSFGLQTISFGHSDFHDARVFLSSDGLVTGFEIIEVPSDRGVGNSVMFMQSNIHREQRREMLARTLVRECKYGRVFQISKNHKQLALNPETVVSNNPRVICIPWELVS